MVARKVVGAGLVLIPLVIFAYATGGWHGIAILYILLLTAGCIMLGIAFLLDL